MVIALQPFQQKPDLRSNSRDTFQLGHGAYTCVSYQNQHSCLLDNSSSDCTPFSMTDFLMEINWVERFHQHWDMFRRLRFCEYPQTVSFHISFWCSEFSIYYLSLLIIFWRKCFYGTGGWIEMPWMAVSRQTSTTWRMLWNCEFFLKFKEAYFKFKFLLNWNAIPRAFFFLFCSPRNLAHNQFSGPFPNFTGMSSLNYV